MTSIGSIPASVTNPTSELPVIAKKEEQVVVQQVAVQVEQVVVAKKEEKKEPVAVKAEPVVAEVAAEVVADAELSEVANKA